MVVPHLAFDAAIGKHVANRHGGVAFCGHYAPVVSPYKRNERLKVFARALADCRGAMARTCADDVKARNAIRASSGFLSSRPGSRVAHPSSDRATRRSGSPAVASDSVEKTCRTEVGVSQICWPSCHTGGPARFWALTLLANCHALAPQHDGYLCRQRDIVITAPQRDAIGR